MIDMTGKVVLVTGASRGIGAATARALGGAGADVVVHYAANRKAAETVAAQLNEGPGEERAHLVQADLAGDDAPGRLWAEAYRWRGRIDVLVNNAGVYEPASVDGGDKEWSANWARTLRINLTAVGDLCRAAILAFSEDGGGIIVNIASRAAFRGESPDYMAYAAAKAGVVALTRTIARGWAHSGILAYAVAPGYVETDMAAGALAGTGTRAAEIAAIPMGAMAPASDVAHVVCFLASGLAPHATGTTVDVNGASYVR